MNKIYSYFMSDVPCLAGENHESTYWMFTWVLQYPLPNLQADDGLYGQERVIKFINFMQVTFFNLCDEICWHSMNVTCKIPWLELPKRHLPKAWYGPCLLAKIAGFFSLFNTLVLPSTKRFLTLLLQSYIRSAVALGQEDEGSLSRCGCHLSSLVSLM